MPIISFIVTVYNTKEEWFRECMTSLITQTEANIEIIIVDDGSVSSIRKICDEYEKKDNRIKVIHENNQGVSVARNKGVSCAIGRYVSFIDSDDYVENNMVENLKNVINTYNDDIVAFAHNDIILNSCINSVISDIDIYTRYNFFNKEEIQKKLLYSDDKNKYPMFFGAQWNIIYSLDFIKRYKLKNISGLVRSEDTVYNLYAVENAKNIGYLNMALYNYRINNDSALNRSQKDITFLINLLDNIVLFAKAYNKSNDFYITIMQFFAAYLYASMKLYFLVTQQSFEAKCNQLIKLYNSKGYKCINKRYLKKELKWFQKIFLYMFDHKNLVGMIVLYYTKEIASKIKRIIFK